MALVNNRFAALTLPEAWAFKPQSKMGVLSQQSKLSHLEGSDAEGCCTALIAEWTC